MELGVRAVAGSIGFWVSFLGEFGRGGDGLLRVASVSAESALIVCGVDVFDEIFFKKKARIRACLALARRKFGNYGRSKNDRSFLSPAIALDECAFQFAHSGMNRNVRRFAKNER